MKGMWICMTATSTWQSNIYQVPSLHLQLRAHIAIPPSVSELLMKLYTIYHTNGLNLCVDILGSLLEKVLAFKCHLNPLHSSPPLPCMLQGPNICTTTNSHVVWPGNNPHGLFNLSPSSFFFSPRHPDASTWQSNIYQVPSLHLQLCAHIAIPPSVSELLMKLYTIYHTNGLNLCVDILGSLLEKVLAFKCHLNPLHSSPPLPCMLQGPNICTTTNSHVVWPGNNPHGLFNLSPSSFFFSPRHPDDPCDSSPCRVHCSAVWTAPSCSLSSQVRIISTFNF